MRRRWQIVRPGLVALVALTLITGVVIALAAQRLYGAPPPAAAGRSELPPQPSVAFVGDSFTSGTRDGGNGPANWTAMLSARSGWTATNLAADGAGYVAASPGGGPFAAQVPRVVAARPSLVVVAGGRTDSFAGPATIRAAAGALYRDLRAQLPQARIVVVGPIWPGGNPPAPTVAARDAIRDAAADARLPFLDPIDGGWFADPDDPGIAPDGEHLTDRGHRGMADLVGEGVRRAGATPR